MAKKKRQDIVTPPTQPLSDYERRQQEEKAKITKATQEVIAACDKKARMDEVFANALDAHTCPSLYLEWTVNKFWGLQMPKLLKDLDRIYAKLVKDKLTEKVNHDFNDGDDRVFFIPHRKKKVIVHTGQSFRFIYIWDKGETHGFQKLHVRQFYDVWNVEDDREWRQREVDEFKAEVAQKGYEPAIKQAQHFTEEWADDYKDNPYPHRLSLQHYKDNGFEVRYGDFRDRGYVLSWQEFRGDVEGAMYTHHKIKLIGECFVPSILCELFGDTDEAITSNDTSVEKDFDSNP